MDELRGSNSHDEILMLCGLGTILLLALAFAVVAGRWAYHGFSG